MADSSLAPLFHCRELYCPNITSVFQLLKFGRIHGLTKMAVERQRPWFITIGQCQIKNLRLSQWSGYGLVQIPRHARFLHEPKVRIVAGSGFQQNSFDMRDLARLASTAFRWKG